jgi:glycosyltransferase involved in cell wall biosynthesis
VGLRICFLSSMHPPTDKRVFYKEAVALAAAGHDVVHVAPGDGREWTQSGVRIVTYAQARGLRERLFDMARLYRRARAVGADVYHCNEPDSWIVGAALRLFRGRAFIFDVHEHYPEDIAEFRFPRWTRPAVRAIGSATMRWLSRFTSAIVLAKSSLLEQFSHLPADRVVLVENFVSLEALTPAPRRARKGGPLRLIHLGLFSRVRGWPEVLKGFALARSKDIELLALGEINDGTEEEFQAEVKRLGLTGRVRYEKWVPYDEAMQHVNASHVGLVAFQPGLYSHVHALPHKMFDYMAGELALIAPDFAVEVAAIVRDAKCGILVDPSNPRAIADAIDRLSDDPELLRTLGHQGRESVISRYNWEAEARKLIDLYRRLEARLGHA